MKILVVTQYFWPESFRINDLCIGLHERGHEVVVLTGKPNYPKGHFYDDYSFLNKRQERWNGIKIYRSPLIPRGNGGGIRLFINYLSFALFASLKVLFIKGKYDKIFVYEPSPITVGIPAIVAKFKFNAPIYFWVQDLWPESLIAGGGLNNTVIIRVFNSITKFIYKHSKVILVQSEAFRTYINNQGVINDKIVYYPNSTEAFYKVMKKDEVFDKLLPEGFKIMFAGNIGEAQDFETLLLAAKILKDKNVPVKWVILGDGRMKKHVENQIQELGLKSVFILLGSYPAEDMPRFFSCVDGLIVSLKKNYIFSLTIPSKVQSYLACGKPLIASLDGEGARIIKEAQAGIVAPSEDFESLAKAIEFLYFLSDDKRLSMGNSAREYFEKEFERETLIDKLEVILNE
ncbi:glycosyltransferase family 4 protein [Pedobacter gandavensis]|uniref:glycosyltransferase family 4 protein n=1 Tax=Pedobacter gandavensis TaxID=2679963 RepID=UPI002931D7A6|nr:glycosyltransferase family 4 protein [Pedobacter gandavensis]